MKRKIAIVTGTRAEYGLLYWIMKEIEKSAKLQLQLIVTGMHLSPQFGNTYEQIERDEFNIDKKVDMGILDDTPLSVAKSMGIAVMGFAQAYQELKPDLLMILGDRYEMLAAVSAAIPFNIPVAHIHGGEITEGAVDEQIRHAITKISHVHFVSAEQYAQNIRKMGEEAWRVFYVGAPGLEWIQKNKYLTREELARELGIDLKQKVILATFHPVTLELEEAEKYIENIIKAIIRANFQVIFTGANSDPCGMSINKKIQEASEIYNNIIFFNNLGQRRYLSCQKYCSLMLGNSSSGIIEAASFGLPVVNIGNRQKGRLQSGNVINVGYDEHQIYQGITSALSHEFREKIKGLTNVYGDGHVSEKIVRILETMDFQKLRYKRLAYE